MHHVLCAICRISRRIFLTAVLVVPPRVLGAIKSSIETLSFFPQIGRLLDDAGHRRIPVLPYPYLIFYRAAGDDLFLFHIRHTSRHPVDPAIDL
jgi:plasmid stabilization system protein ParE